MSYFDPYFSSKLGKMYSVSGNTMKIRMNIYTDRIWQYEYKGNAVLYKEWREIENIEIHTRKP